MTIPFHPLADLFPLIEGDEFAVFCDSLRKDGQSEPVILHEGKVLDGRNRALACARLGIPLHTRDWNGEGGSPLNFVIARNLHRRHLTTSQRALIAAKLLPLLAAQQVAKLPPGKKHRDQAAATLSVSPRSVQDAVKVERAGTPALKAAVQTGKLAVSKAADIADLPAAEQAERINVAEKKASASRKKDDRIADLTTAHKQAQKAQRIVEKYGGSGACFDAVYLEIERLRKTT